MAFPDFSPLIVALLAALAVFAALRACIGRVDRSVPRCRRCGRDARDFVWREEFECDCASKLDRVGTVRFPRRRSKRLFALALFLIVASGLLAWWSIGVRSMGVGWRDELPTWAYVRLVRWGWDHPFHLSATRRIFDDCSVDDAELMRDAALDRWESGNESTQELWRMLMHAAAIAPPEGAIGERYARVLAGQFEFVATQRGQDIVLRSHHINGRSSWERPCVVRITSVRIDDREVPFTVRQERSRTVERPVDDDREWRSLERDDVGVVISNETLLSNSKIRVRGLIASVPVPRDVLDVDEVIATNVDPSAWGVSVALAPLDAPVVEVVTDSKPDGYGNWFDRVRRWTDVLWGREESIEVMPSAAAVGTVVMTSVTVALALLVGVSIPVARGVGRGRTRLAPPACPRCSALLRAEGEALPGRCAECGAEIAGRDHCRWVVATSRWRRGACAILAAALVATALIFTPSLYGAVYLNVEDILTTPEAQGAWLVDATIADRPHAMGPSPANRLRDLDEKVTSLDAAAAELLTWWFATKGTLPHSARDREGRGRRAELGALLARAFAANLVSVDEAKPIAEWCAARDPLDPWFDVPVIVRAGEPVRLTSRGPLFVRGIDYATEKGIGDWVRPSEFAIDLVEEPRISSRQFEVWRDLQWRPGWGAAVPAATAPLTNGSGAYFPSNIVVEAEVEALPANAPQALVGAALERVVRELFVELRLRETGARDVLQIFTTAGMQRIGMLGRWEVCADDGDAAPLVTLRPHPSSGGYIGLAALPDPWPKAFFLRFVPELPEDGGQGRSGDFVWAERRTFRVERGEDARFEADVIARFH